MSAGTLVIGSRTPPVEEVIRHGENGLVDFFDVNGLAESVTEALAVPARFAELRRAGRETVRRRYDLRRVCLPDWAELIRAAYGEVTQADPGLAAPSHLLAAASTA
jgi:glycosyltransferase involved in cell wall biosynthesis